VLNDTPGAFVAQETKKLVLQTAKKLGYHNSLISRSIKKSLKHIAIATTNRRLEYIDSNRLIFDEFRRTALERNYFSVDLPLPVGVGGRTSPSVIKRMLELYRTKLVDGYLIDKVEFTNDAIFKLKRAAIPMVMVNGEPYLKENSKKIYVSAVITNTFQAAELAVKHLVRLGHRKISLLGKPYLSYEKKFHPYMVSRLRKGFLHSMETASATTNQSMIVDGDPSDRSITQAAITKLFSRKNRSTALIVGDDGMGIVALQQLEKMGFQIPRDISLISVGGHRAITKLSEMELTTVTAPYERNGKIAAEILIGKIESKITLDELTELDCELIEGKTTARVWKD
jgi:LacI family transcriptional regulator